MEQRMSTKDLQHLVGKTEEEARTLIESYNMTTRLVGRDGRAFVVTMDYRLDRVNIVVHDGNVTRVHVG